MDRISACAMRRPPTLQLFSMIGVAGMHRADRRRAGRGRAVHALRRLHHVGRDGGGVLVLSANRRRAASCRSRTAATVEVLFCFVFLYFVFAGSGPWSLDACCARRLRRTTSSTEDSVTPNRRSARREHCVHAALTWMSSPLNARFRYQPRVHVTAPPILDDLRLIMLVVAVIIVVLRSESSSASSSDCCASSTAPRKYLGFPAHARGCPRRCR